MTVCGKPGKRWCCFPPFPHTLEIDETDSHIPTATTMTRMNQISSKPGPLRDTHSEGKGTFAVQERESLGFRSLQSAGGRSLEALLFRPFFDGVFRSLR